jgi:CheY-like chemotaxis protein
MMTLLFIDDDPDDTELFCEAVNYINNSEFLETHKHKINCVTYNDGCKAVDLMARLTELPDYIFLDINMPLMSGKECIKQLKGNPDLFKIPVIMFSTAFRENDAVEFKALGALDCIRKPSGFNELVKILSRFVYKKFL